MEFGKKRLCIKLKYLHSWHSFRWATTLPATLKRWWEVFPDEVGGGEAALNRLEDKTPSGQGAFDEVFVDGGVAEERGKGDPLDQRELLDTTDALLMDATNKMDDTAFLDEVIARNCRSYGSTDDDYIDEVIARCCDLMLPF